MRSITAGPLAAIDLGSLPDWLAGVGALAALYFAYRAARSVRTTNEQQSQALDFQRTQIAALENDRAKVVEDERRSQATKVALVSLNTDIGGEIRAIVRSWATEQAVRQAAYPDDRGFLDSLHLVNTSGAPVLSLQVYCATVRIGLAALLPTTATPFNIAERSHITWPDEAIEENAVRQMFDGEAVGVLFVDMEGNGWARSLSGRLWPYPEARPIRMYPFLGDR